LRVHENVTTSCAEIPADLLTLNGSLRIMVKNPDLQLSESQVLTIIGPNRVATVSSANFLAPLASESIASIFGVGLAQVTQSTRVTPPPFSISGTSVSVRDSQNNEREARLFFVSPLQINFLVPDRLSTGAALVTVKLNNEIVGVGEIQIQPIAPGLFTANANGQGIAAADLLRVKANGTQSYEYIARFDQTQNKFVSIPIDLSVATDDKVFLILYGTGLRNHGNLTNLTNLTNVTVTMGGTNAQVLYAGAQGDLVGLDQINVAIPRSLIGRGEIDVALTVNGRVTNTVRVNIK
jgi:uncharacterized protein (TIGR03437 family)